MTDPEGYRRPVPEKTVLITGGNAGLGLETAVALAALGDSVTITARDPARGEAARAEIVERSGSETVEVMALDLASTASIRSFAAAFLDTHPRLHVLVNNAGLILSERTETEDGFETTFGVNHLGHVLLTDLLLDRLKASAPARIVVVASDAHKFALDGLKFDDLQCHGHYWSYRVYGRSKLANIYFMRALAKRLEGTGVTVNAVHPGSVATRFGRHHGGGPTVLPDPRGGGPDPGRGRHRPGPRGGLGHVLLQLEAGRQAALPGRPRRRGRRTPLDGEPGAPRPHPLTGAAAVLSEG